MEWLKNDRKAYLVGSAAVAVFSISATVARGRYLESGWLHPLLTLGILSAVFCIGLWLRQGWCRWVGFAILIAGVGLVIWRGHLVGFSLTRIATIAISPVMLWYLWKLPVTEAEELLSDPQLLMEHIGKKLDSLKRWKIAILLDGDLRFDAAMLAKRAGRAFDAHFDAIDEAIDPVDACFLGADHPSPIVAGVKPIFVCSWPPFLFLISTLRVPYLDEQAAPEEQVIAAAAKKPSRRQTTYVEIWLEPHYPHSDPIDKGYRWTGRLAAALAGDDCMSVCLPEDDLSYTMTPRVRRALRSEDPLGELAQLPGHAMAGEEPRACE